MTNPEFGQGGPIPENLAKLPTQREGRKKRNDLGQQSRRATLEHSEISLPSARREATKAHDFWPPSNHPEEWQIAKFKRKLALGGERGQQVLEIGMDPNSGYVFDRGAYEKWQKERTWDQCRHELAELWQACTPDDLNPWLTPEQLAEWDEHRQEKLKER